MPPTDLRVAVAFPGQGLAKADVADVLEQHVGHELVGRLAELIATDDWRGLDWSDTAVVQPCVYASSLMNAQAHMDPARCAAVTGHSLGEIAALTFLGVMDPIDGLELATARGKLCSAGAIAPGGMSAFMQIDAHELEWIRRTTIASTGEVLEVAARNGTDQVVMTGGLKALDQAATEARAVGALVIELPIGGSFHSPLMAVAAQQFKSLLDAVEFAAPSKPFVSTILARQLDDLTLIRQSLYRGLVLPVAWLATLDVLHDLGIAQAYDAGPGDTLRKLGARSGPVKFRAVANA